MPQESQLLLELKKTLIGQHIIPEEKKPVLHLLDEEVKGLLLVLLSAILFGAMGMMVKTLNNRVPLMELAFFRSAIALIPLTLFLRHKNISLRSSQWPALTLRGIWGLLAMLCYFWALSHIPLALAVLLNYSSPIFATLLAVFLFKERFFWITLVSLIVSMTGLGVILKPGFGGPLLGLLIGLGAGIFSGAAYTTVKYLTARESPWRIVWYFNLAASLGTLPLALGQWQTPHLSDGLWLVAISAAGTLAQIFMTKGFELCALSKGSIATLLIVVITTLGGWLFWHEIPGPNQFVGIALVIGGILGLAYPAHGKPSSLKEMP